MQNNEMQGRRMRSPAFPKLAFLCPFLAANSSHAFSFLALSGSPSDVVTKASRSEPGCRHRKVVHRTGTEAQMRYVDDVTRRSVV